MNDESTVYGIVQERVPYVVVALIRMGQHKSDSFVAIRHMFITSRLVSKYYRLQSVMENQTEDVNNRNLWFLFCELTIPSHRNVPCFAEQFRQLYEHEQRPAVQSRRAKLLPDSMRKPIRKQRGRKIIVVQK